MIPFFMKSVTWRAFDRLGMTLSMACAIHCLVMPVLIPLLPLLASSFLTGETTESVILTATLLIAAPTLFRGYLKHRKFRVPAIFLLGLLFLALRPGAFHHDHVHEGEVWHFVLAALAGLSLAIGHWLNLRLCKSCPSCKDGESHCHSD
jgi:hypothetical protein